MRERLVGYNVLGIDVSEAMAGMSRSRVREAEVGVASLFEANILRATPSRRSAKSSTPSSIPPTTEIGR